MISPIVTRRFAPIVRLILTKSYTPATLCTVPQEHHSSRRNSCLFIVNPSYWIASARCLKDFRIQPKRLAGAWRAQRETLLSFL